MWSRVHNPWFFTSNTWWRVYYVGCDLWVFDAARGDRPPLTPRLSWLAGPTVTSLLGFILRRALVTVTWRDISVDTLQMGHTEPHVGVGVVVVVVVCCVNVGG